MISRRAYQAALEKLGFRQKAYQHAFGIEGSPAHLALVDLADYCGVFSDGFDDPKGERLLLMAGRRQAFFRIWTHLNLTNTEMEIVCKGALLRAASRLTSIETGE